MIEIIGGAVAGAISGIIVTCIMASRLIKKLDAIDENYTKEIFEISSEAINKLSQNIYRNL